MPSFFSLETQPKGTHQPSKTWLKANTTQKNGRRKHNYLRIFFACMISPVLLSLISRQKFEDQEKAELLKKVRVLEIEEMLIRENTRAESNFSSSVEYLFGDQQERQRVFERQKADFIAEAVAKQNISVPSDPLPPISKLNTILPEFQPQESWAATKFPKLHVVGFPKAGTSQLYKILAMHQQVKPQNPIQKEACARANWTTAESLQKDLHNYFRNEVQCHSENTITVNGCLDMEDVHARMQYLNVQTRNDVIQAKYLMIFRNPPDWIWSVWNFWIDNRIDTFTGRTKEGNFWTNEGVHYRSPELFHEFVASQGKLKGFATVDKVPLVDNLGILFRNLVGKDNLLALRNEDMEPHRIMERGGMLEKISNFTGLPLNEFDQSALLHKMNCQSSKKGSRKECEDDGDHNKYPISGGRSMLPATRELINIWYSPHCKMWKREFGIEYPDCIHALDKYETAQRSE